MKEIKELIMEKELQDNLILVINFLGKEQNSQGYIWNDEGEYVEPDYHENWQTQIPVWAKLCKDQFLYMLIDNSYQKEWLEYHHAIDNDNPHAGFDIIVSIIKRIT